MAESSWSHTLVWVSLAGALAGCSTVPDSPRSVSPLVDAATPSSELVLKAEPPSRTGNADTYVVFGRRYRVRETSAGYQERGIASWYGWEFHGRKTSSGSPYNMFALTAAHKSLPLPTYVRVTNLDNGRNTVVKVTDRGPFVGSRLIDLSYAAAGQLGMLGQGTAPVEVVALEPYQSLPNLAARRAEQRELLASRAARAKAKMEVAQIEFAHDTPIRPLALAPVQPSVVLADSDRNPPSVKPPVRLAQEDEAFAAPHTVTKPPVRLARADVERDTPKVVMKPSIRLAQEDEAFAAPRAVTKPPIRLVQKDMKRDTPKVVVKPPVRLVQVDLERDTPKVVAKPLIRLALADVKRNSPPTAAKVTNAKPAKAEDSRNPMRAGLHPPSAAPITKGREAGAKPAVPAANANNRAGKPVLPRQASESKPTTVRLASLKLNRSRGIVD